MTPLIVVDARMVGAIPHGIARYVTELSNGLALLKKKEDLPYDLLFLVQSESFSKHFSPFKTFELPVSFLHPKELFQIPKVLKNLGAALYHSPSFSSLWTCPCPSIITIHDLNHLSFGGWSQKIYYQTLLRQFALRSECVMTVSEFSRQELSAWLHLPEEKIEIVHNSIEPPAQMTSPQAATAVLTQFGLESGRYFFCLSNPKLHKNLPLLIQAYQMFRRQASTAWPLVLTISPQSKVSQSIEGIKTIGGQAERDVDHLLSNAGGGLFPSLYEGFGLPPVEAAVCGTPLAVSDIPPHREGLQDLGPGEVFWVSPKDLHGWINAFHRLMKGEISSPSAANRQKILERFHVAKMGQKMDQIYRHVLKISYATHH